VWFSLAYSTRTGWFAGQPTGRISCPLLHGVGMFSNVMIVDSRVGVVSVIGYFSVLWGLGMINRSDQLRKVMKDDEPRTVPINRKKNPHLTSVPPRSFPH